MKSTAEYIKRARRQALDTDADANRGVPDQNYIDYMGDAVEHLASLVFAEFPDFYETQEEISVVANQRTYALNSAMFNPVAVRQVEHSIDGSVNDYRLLLPLSLMELGVEEGGIPSEYAVRSGTLYIGPIPTSAVGKLRSTYYRKPYRPDIRRGNLTAATSTTMTLAVSGPAPDATLLDAALDNGGFVCVVDAMGTVIKAAMPVTDYNSATRVLTGTFTGYTFASGHYLTIGQYATTHIDVPINWERFIVKYAATEVMANEKGGTTRVAPNREMLAAMQEDILDSIRNSSPALQLPPNITRF